MIKLEQKGNFLLVTDTNTGQETRFSCKDTYYSFEDRNRILVITWDKTKESVTHKYLVRDIVDVLEQTITLEQIDTFLSETLGFKRGGTSPYKVFTALVTQKGGTAPDSISGGETLVGRTYEIQDSGGGKYDFTNIGAPNNISGTKFIATGKIPNSWGDAILKYNTATPEVEILENSIGNVWCSYEEEGRYNIFGEFVNGKTITNIQAQTGTINGNQISQIVENNKVLRILTEPYENNSNIIKINAKVYDFDNSIVIEDNGRIQGVLLEIRVYN